MKAKRLKAVTPPGILIYPHLNEPDREFDAMGIYHTKMRVSGADAQEFMDKVATFRDEQYQQECSQRGKKKLNQNPLPWTEDEESEGEFIVKFKLKAKVVTRTGDSWEQRPAILDASLKPTTVSVGGGTKARISVEANFYCTPAGDTGVTLWCKAVQVIDLVERGGAGDFGFAATEGFSDEATGTEDLMGAADF
tara:strand:+ start:228 stop:809 length:582 start_codon:yes stop_codon:yes gene_type:complete